MPGVEVESGDIGMNETIFILKKFTLERGRQTRNQIISKPSGKYYGLWENQQSQKGYPPQPWGENGKEVQKGFLRR